MITQKYLDNVTSEIIGLAIKVHKNMSIKLI